MKEKNDIGNEHFADKLKQFSAEPPEGIWENISGELNRGGGRRTLYVILAVAASLALALTVGVKLFYPGNTGDLPDSVVQNDTEQPDQLIEKQAKEPSSIMEERIREAVREALPAEELYAVESTGQRRKVQKPGTGLSDQVAASVIGEVQSLAEAKDDAVAETETQDTDPLNIQAEDTESETGAAPAREEAVTRQEPVSLSLEEAHALGDTLPQFSDKERRTGHWQIGASVSPQYSYRDATSASAMQERMVNRSETGMIAYAGGLQVSYLPSDRFTIETGVYFNKMGLNIGSYESYWARLNPAYDFVASDNRNVVTLSNSIGTIEPKGDEVYVNKYTMQTEFNPIVPVVMTYNGEQISTITQTFSYIEIPLNLRYKVIDRRMDVQLIGGVSTNVLVGNAVIGNTSLESVKIGEVTDVRTMNYSGNAGIGFVYDIFEHLKLSVEPRFRYYLNSVNNPLLPSTRPYSIGLFTGVNYSF